MSTARGDPLGDVSAIATLADPRRRRLYDLVVAQERPVGRDEAAEATGLGRPLVAYHLDRLAAAGLLDVVYRRPEGRSGPGAGRPAKRYLRPQRPLTAQTRARDYELAARLLAEAARRSGGAEAGQARAAAHAEGHALGSALASPDELESALAARGYEPYRDVDGALLLRNCPFHSVAAAYPQLVCAMNAAYVEGVLEGAGAADRVAELDPCAGRCCVVVRPQRR